MTRHILANALRSAIAAVPAFFRPHRCYWGCEFRTQRIGELAQHYHANHAGDRP